MALPPRGDPRRPLHLAIRSSRILGIIFIGLGGLMLVPSVLFAGRMPSFNFMLLAVMALVYVGPGAAYLTCAIFMKRGKVWAVIVALVLSSLLLAYLLIVGVAMAVFMPRPLPREALIPGAILLIFIFAFAQMIYHLAKSFGAIKQLLPDVQRGFDPLPALPNISVGTPPESGGQ